MPVWALIKALKLEGMWKYRWRYTAEWHGTGAQSEHQCSRAYTTHNKWWAAPTNNKHDNKVNVTQTCLFQDNMLAVYMKIVWMHGLKKKWVLVTEMSSLSSHCAISWSGTNSPYVLVKQVSQLSLVIRECSFAALILNTQQSLHQIKVIFLCSAGDLWLTCQLKLKSHLSLKKILISDVVGFS